MRILSSVEINSITLSSGIPNQRHNTCLVHGLYHRDHHNTAVVETGRAVGEWYSFTHARCSEGKGRAVVGNFVLSARNSEENIF
ncbi:unnamed protein product [Wuchereria bancrofti]|uniref:Uncharacterized protein n=1 Tax=Wuchereria bancrofti TaxID=6293 RepID=A0A3P7E427_WUCBA|nr:unnamed protein product [Wuchereria bancrofti]